MKLSTVEKVRVILPSAAMEAIFDECDRFDTEETGGRVIGTYQGKDDQLVLNISGIIEPGPKAQRSAVSFFQDGDFQEAIFRQVERAHPEIEHLGNWHTHHMNGLHTLSTGDVTTYRRIVQHPKHNVPFFYAMLVVSKSCSSEPLNRYVVKHFILFRDADRVYEIPERHIEVRSGPVLWPSVLSPAKCTSTLTSEAQIPRPDRAYDKDFISQFHQNMRPYSSTRLGLYWKGHIDLLGGIRVQVVVTEDLSADTNPYSLVLRETPEPLLTVSENIVERTFPSARAALMFAERECNRTLFDTIQKKPTITHPKRND